MLVRLSPPSPPADLHDPRLADPLCGGNLATRVFARALGLTAHPPLFLVPVRSVRALAIARATSPPARLSSRWAHSQSPQALARRRRSSPGGGFGCWRRMLAAAAAWIPIGTVSRTPHRGHVLRRRPSQVCPHSAHVTSDRGGGRLAGRGFSPIPPLQSPTLRISIVRSCLLPRGTAINCVGSLITPSPPADLHDPRLADPLCGGNLASALAPR